jgi:uncharacterized protein YciI
MPHLFAVTRTRGANWNAALCLEQQPNWAGHAAFMNRLHAEGFVLLGGPLDGTPDVLLIFAANSEQEIHERLAGDSWSKEDLLRIRQISPWNLRLGSIK